SNSSPSSLRTNGSVAPSSGATSTPPGAASIRTSRPPTATCRPPSCQRKTRSTPNARKRSVESAKSYVPGMASSAMPGTLVALAGRAERSRRVADDRAVGRRAVQVRLELRLQGLQTRDHLREAVVELLRLVQALLIGCRAGALLVQAMRDDLQVQTQLAECVRLRSRDGLRLNRGRVVRERCRDGSEREHDQGDAENPLHASSMG